MSKPRSDAKLLNLPEADQLRICDWLIDGVEGDTSYDKVREQIFLDFNMKVSRGTVAEFWNKVVAPIKLQRSKQAALGLNEVAKDKGAAFEDAALAACQQKAFEILAQENPDPKAVLAFFGLVLEAQKVRMKGEDLTLQKKKFQRDTCKLFIQWSADEKAKAIANGSGSNAEKIEQLGRAMFGEDWDE